MCIERFLDRPFPASLFVFYTRRYSVTEPNTCEVKVSLVGRSAAHANLCGKSGGGSLIMHWMLQLSAGTHFALDLMLCNLEGFNVSKTTGPLASRQLFLIFECQGHSLLQNCLGNSRGFCLKWLQTAWFLRATPRERCTKTLTELFHYLRFIAGSGQVPLGRP